VIGDDNLAVVVSVSGVVRALSLLWYGHGGRCSPIGSVNTSSATALTDDPRILPALLVERRGRATVSGT